MDAKDEMKKVIKQLDNEVLKPVRLAKQHKKERIELIKKLHAERNAMKRQDRVDKVKQDAEELGLLKPSKIRIEIIDLPIPIPEKKRSKGVCCRCFMAVFLSLSVMGYLFYLLGAF